MKKKIFVVITARPSYSRVKYALKAIKNHKDLDLTIIASASAMSEKYGAVVNDIENDGFFVKYKLNNLSDSNLENNMVETTSFGMKQISEVFLKDRPDAVLTIADRYETIATAIAASYMNIPLVHLQGGENTGSIDNKVRHAITKLSDLHLACTNKAKNNIISMGENPKDVYATGCPSLDLVKDILSSKVKIDLSLLNKNCNKKIDKIPEEYIIVMQHPDTNFFNQSKQQICEIIEAILKFDKSIFWFYPNIDLGSEAIKNELSLISSHPNIYMFSHIPSMEFIKLLNSTLCLVGNSSVGIRECSFMGVPVVNIGDRQNNRERGNNVIDVDYNNQNILDAIEYQIKTKKYPSNYLYGDGDAGRHIADILASHNLALKKN